MLFMDFRRHHSGVWQGAGPKLRPGLHPNAGEGMWGTSGEVPSFLYAMPLGNGRVFLEETCLVAKPALPFSVLKRRLQRRLEAMGVKVWWWWWWWVWLFVGIVVCGCVCLLNV